MVHYSKVIQGIAHFIDNEFITKLAGSWKAWAFGAFASLAVSEAETLFRKYKDVPLLTAMRLVEGENINVDRIYAELQKQAQKGNATATLPIVGPVTFGPADVDALYRYIKA